MTYYTVATKKSTNMGHGMGNRTDYIIEPLPLKGGHGYISSEDYPPLFSNIEDASYYNKKFHNGLGIVVEMKVSIT